MTSRALLELPGLPWGPFQHQPGTVYLKRFWPGLPWAHLAPWASKLLGDLPSSPGAARAPLGSLLPWALWAPLCFVGCLNGSPGLPKAPLGFLASLGLPGLPFALWAPPEDLQGLPGFLGLP